MRTMTTLAVTAALLAIAGILIYMIGAKRVSVATKTLDSKQKQVEDSKKIAGRLVQAQENYEKAQAELGFLETSVSTYAYVPTLLGQIEDLGKTYNLRVCAVRPQKSEPPPPPAIKRTSEDPSAAPENSSSASNATGNAEATKPYEELQIEIELEGSYWCVHDFLQSLTQFPKIVAVKEVRIAPTDALSRRGSPKLAVRLVVTAFIFKPEDTGNAADSNTSPQPVNSSAILDGRSSHEG